MTVLRHFFYRLYHAGLRLFVRVYPFPKPLLMHGHGAFEQWREYLAHHQYRQVLVITDATLHKLGVINPVCDLLAELNITYQLYSDVEPNPSIKTIESGVTVYRQHHCEALIAIGGGSVIDCAKLIGARAVKPQQSLLKMKGLFKILQALPPLHALPTTAGTGSETTVAAVFTDPNTHQKYAVSDLCLMPKIAVLLPELTTQLPASLTATTAMDALTHAIEAYIGINGLAFSDERALSACEMIFAHLPLCMANLKEREHREQLLLASFYAGEAFTRTSVGYVHAFAHNLGAKYGLAHGFANAVILPHILRWYGASIHLKLADIAYRSGLSESTMSIEQAAESVILRIESLNRSMDIPAGFSQIASSDIPMLAKLILAEAHPDYPVPQFMKISECETLLKQLMNG